MKKCFKENKQLKEMNKTVQELEVVIESKKKTQNEGSLGVKMDELKTGVLGVSPTNRIQEKEERRSGLEDMIKKWIP